MLSEVFYVFRFFFLFLFVLNSFINVYLRCLLVLVGIIDGLAYINSNISYVFTSRRRRLLGPEHPSTLNVAMNLLLALVLVFVLLLLLLFL